MKLRVSRGQGVRTNMEFEGGAARTVFSGTLGPICICLLMTFITDLVPEAKPRALHMPGKHSTAELYLQPGVHIMGLLGQSGQLRCGEQARVEGVKNGYETSAAVEPSSKAAAVRSEGVMRKRWV